jgi:chemotaxis protein methyltransferase CheR
MRDCDCVGLLQWALPRLHLQWHGFRKVRGQVCKRIQRRMRELSITDVAHYRAHLEHHADEWLLLRDLCRITISRFWRDKGAYLSLGTDVLPALARQANQRGADTLRVWSAGCGSGEEPYSLTLLWELNLRDRFPSLKLHVLATDIDNALLTRAKTACYGRGSLKDLPADWYAIAFEQIDDTHCLRQRFKHGVTFRHHDVRGPPPSNRFDLILCRNLAFTYFDESQQRAVIGRLINALVHDGALMLGSHEQLPVDERRLKAWPALPCFFTAQERFRT